MRRRGSPLTRVLGIGITPALAPETAQLVTMSNGVTAFVQFAAVVAIIIDIITGISELSMAAGGLIVLIGFTFILNTLGRHVTAGIWIISSLGLSVLGAALLAGSAALQPATYFICGLPFLLFGLRERSALTFSLGIAFLVFVLLSWPGVLPTPWLDLDAQQWRVVQSTLGGLGWLALLLLIGHFALTREHVMSELRKALAKAEVASETKSAFLANTTHELRTPLSAILGYADLLLSPDLSPEERSNFVRTILRNGRHLLELVDQVLDHAKIEAGQFEVAREPCSLERLVSDVEALMHVRATAKGVEFDVEYLTRIPELIVSDELRVRQILVNLVGNAIKFTEKGRVLLRVSVTIDDKDQRVTLHFAVEDDGPGIAPGHLDEMFEPFVQADMSTQRTYGGTGLGLAISRQLAHMLGGTLTVASELGRGSIFTLSLDIGPLSELDELVHPHMATEPTTMRARTMSGMLGMRVLVVDDGDDNRRLLELYLQRSGAEPTLASNGVEALERYRESVATDTPFDIIIMDMQMPEMDGYTATRSLRDMGCDLPVFALTAHAMPSARGECLEAGCDQYFVKPVEFDSLFRAMLEVVEERGGPSGGRTENAFHDLAEDLESPGTADNGTGDADEEAMQRFEAELATMTRDFTRRLPEEVANIQSSLADGDLDSVRFLAHRLKGTAGVYGLDRVSELAGEIEEAVDRHADGTELSTYVQALAELAHQAIC